MEITDIIKEAMIFPSGGISQLAIYIVLSIVGVILALFGIGFIGIGLVDNVVWAVLGIILLIAGLALVFVILGYQVSIIKSGIDRSEDVPEFDWMANLVTGIKYLVLNIVYFIIPAIIVLIVAWAMNLFGMAAEMFTKMANASMAAGGSTVAFAEVVPQSLIISFGTALMVTGLVAFVLFLIFAFIKAMGESRLANTDSLGDGLNIPEAFKDMGKIGYVKVILVVVIIFVIIAVINAILNGLNYYINGISILSIIITPYLTFFAARATGLLYSEIA